MLQPRGDDPVKARGDLLRRRRCRQVKVRRRLPPQRIPDAPADKIGAVPPLPQPLQRLAGSRGEGEGLARPLRQRPPRRNVIPPEIPRRIPPTGQIVLQQRRAGAAVLLISADLAEILQLADRIAVCYEGRILGVFDGKDPPVEEISLAMAGRSVQNSPAGCVQNLD